MRGQWVPMVHDGVEVGRYWRRSLPQVPDRWLRSVVHLYGSDADARDGASYGATAFLVSVAGVDVDAGEFQTPNERDQAEQDGAIFRSFYVATANHNLTGGATVLRVNTLPTTPDPFIQPTTVDEWERWPEHDLAVLPIELDPSRLDFDAVPITRLAGALPGDDVFMVGRFVEESGRAHNEVQVRFGNVSMLPGEPLDTDAGPLVAYLAEMRSRGGFSGSPVFVYRPSYGAVLGGSDGMYGAELLGVDQGHYPTLLEAVDKQGRRIGDFYIRERSALSVVIPAGRLADLLIRGRLRDMRKKKHDEHKDRPRAVADSSHAEDSEERFTKADFEDALGKATKRVKQPKKS
jgi:hypothetical protein